MIPSDSVTDVRCTKCGGLREDVRFRRCKACREKFMVIDRNLRETRAKLRRCIACSSRDLRAGYSTCEKCCANGRRRTIERHAELAACGFCITCRKVNDGPTNQCLACLKKRRDDANARSSKIQRLERELAEVRAQIKP